MNLVEKIIRPVQAKFGIKFLAFVVYIIAYLLTQGCAYRRGSGSSIPYHSVYVDSICNHSQLTEFQKILRQQLVYGLNEIAHLKSSSIKDADAILRVHIDGLCQRIATTSKHDSAVANSYTLSIQSRCTLEMDGKIFLKDIPVETSIDISTQPSFIEAKRQAIPQLTRDLATKICHLVAYP
jgi:hypothetical protein